MVSSKLSQGFMPITLCQLLFLNNLGLVHVCMQLTGKKLATSDSDVTSEEQEEDSERGDATSENTNVVGLIQVYCAFLRLLLACMVVYFLP